MAWTIQAKYSGTCSVCGKTFRKGDQITCERGQGAWHPDCEVTKGVDQDADRGDLLARLDQLQGVAERLAALIYELKQDAAQALKEETITRGAQRAAAQLVPVSAPPVTVNNGPTKVDTTVKLACRNTIHQGADRVNGRLAPEPRRAAKRQGKRQPNPFWQGLKELADMAEDYQAAEDTAESADAEARQRMAQAGTSARFAGIDFRD